jgi:hypothetical protein
MLQLLVFAALWRALLAQPIQPCTFGCISACPLPLTLRSLSAVSVCCMLTACRVQACTVLGFLLTKPQYLDLVGPAVLGPGQGGVLWYAQHL